MLKRCKKTCFGNNLSMRNKEYIEKAKETILNRVRFHAPVVYDDQIDKSVLFANGIDISKPIFKFDKVLTKKLVKAFELAQKEEDFNLVLSYSSLGNLGGNALKQLKTFTYYSKETSPVSLVEMINKLNINYQASSNYNLVFKEKFFKVNKQILNPHFENFCLKQTSVIDDIFVDYNEFVLNGTNFFVNLQNKTKDKKKVAIELNIPLQKGYYYFKKLPNSVLIENLLTKEKIYLNFVCRNAKFSFSNVDGLENSVFCCINVKINFNLEKQEEKFVFFNLGDAKFALKYLNDIKKFQLLARNKSCEIFNVQVKTKNAKFDNFFNKVLPQKIWINWLNGEVDLKWEEKYLTLKKMFIKGVQNYSFVPFKEIGLKELGIFNGEYYKKIIVVSGNEKFLKVGKTFFYNINGVTNHSLKSKEPICLSFGE